jgi:hypothetical protein
LTNVSFMSAGENELSTVPQEIGESNIWYLDRLYRAVL